MTILSKLKDLTGRLFGYLSVQKRLANYRQTNNRTRTRWLCLCLLCGNAYIADGSHLLHGNIISCGCLRKIKSSNRMHEVWENEHEKMYNHLKNIHKNTKGTIKLDHPLSKDERGEILNDNIEILEIVPSKNGKRTYLCKCLLCGTLFEARANSLRRGLIRSCGCVLSFAEKTIRKYLNEQKINYKQHFWFDDLRGETGRPYQFDFGFLDQNKFLIALLEYQGEQHDTELMSKKKNNKFGKQQREVTDIIKKEYCKKNNIKLYEIWYYQDIYEELDKIIKEISQVNPVPSS